MLVSSGFSVYLMTQSLESHNLDKINLMVHLKLLVTLPCIVKPFYPLKIRPLFVDFEFLIRDFHRFNADGRVITIIHYCRAP